MASAIELIVLFLVQSAAETVSSLEVSIKRYQV